MFEASNKSARLLFVTATLSLSLFSLSLSYRVVIYTHTHTHKERERKRPSRYVFGRNFRRKKKEKTPKREEEEEEEECKEDIPPPLFLLHLRVERLKAKSTIYRRRSRDTTGNEERHRPVWMFATQNLREFSPRSANVAKRSHHRSVRVVTSLASRE